jgi:hemerythrin-like domain-containing protein
MTLGYAGKAAAFQAPTNPSGSDKFPTKRQLKAAYRLVMIKLDILRHQHEAALDMAQRLLELIEGYKAGTPAHSLLTQLNRLYGVLRLHLAHEDVELYPALMASTDPKVARTAKLFADEMGGLALDVECFARHWSCSASIASNFQEFREAAQDLIIALAARIERENQYLYPLADAALASRERRDAA